MSNEPILSLVNMRLKLCSKNQKCQSIVAYGFLKNESSKPQNDQTDRLIRYFYAHGSDYNAIKEINRRTYRKGYKRRPISGSMETKSYSIFGWSATKDYRYFLSPYPYFSMDCAKRSFCHIAAKGLYKKNENDQIYLKRDNMQTPQEAYFGLSACIKNKPGTIYALLSMLTGDNPSQMKDDKHSFDFNVEHLRSCLCRVTNSVKIDLYGYFNDNQQKKTNNESALDRLHNVQAVVFHDIDKEKQKTIRDLKNLVQKYIYNDTICSHADAKCEHIFEETKLPIPDNQQTSFKTFLYKNKNAGKIKKKWEANECPIARYIDCQETYEEQKAHSTIKIEVCLKNVPGALKELGRIIAAE